MAPDNSLVKLPTVILDIWKVVEAHPNRSEDCRK